MGYRVGLFACNEDGSVDKDGVPGSPNEGAAAWAQWTQQNPDLSDWEYYCHDLNADENNPEGYWRCNIFAWDSYVKGGNISGSAIPRSLVYSDYPALANEIGDETFSPSNLDVIRADSLLVPGDIISYPALEGPGHVVIIGCDGRAYWASADKIGTQYVGPLNAWWKPRIPVYRRPKF